MKAPTHMAFGVLVGTALGAPPQMTVALLLGSLFPDTDHLKSTLGRIIPLGLFIKHRTVTHSILAVVIAVLIHPWFGVGYASHVLIDSLNPMGVPFFFPVKKKIRFAKIYTGSFLEIMILGLIIFLIWKSDFSLLSIM